MKVDDPPGRDPSLPTWQRGHRVHGYWLGHRRVGHVGLSPRGIPPVVYSWAIDGTRIGGEAQTLRAARRQVEDSFRQLREEEDGRRMAERAAPILAEPQGPIEGLVALESRTDHGICCPRCHGEETSVIETRPSAGGLRRRRRCLAPGCGGKLTTLEIPTPTNRHVKIADFVLAPRAWLAEIRKMLATIGEAIGGAMTVGSPTTRSVNSPSQETVEDERATCPGEDCLMCSGEACNLCGAGCRDDNARHCEHDAMERHEDPDPGGSADHPVKYEDPLAR